ncbi:MAG: amidohydrolase family protein [Coriobacteriaceae bacterium]|nr:amidohydrolase family protein [Coriobacteriaceae bacterium]
MSVVDIHTHIYPDKIAQKAVEGVGRFYNVQMSGAGTLSGLLKAEAGSGITHNVVHSVALKPDQVMSINDFIAEQCKEHDNLIGFATMHQDFVNIPTEVERCIELGLKGFKLHPDSQGVNLDDPRLMQLYEYIEGRLPIIFHTGDYRYDYSHPHRLKRVLHEFPNLTVNAAHLGGWSIPDLALEYLEHEHCFFDVSSSMMYLGQRRSIELIEHYGYDRILFGADYPMWNPAIELETFRSLGFSTAAYQKMLWHNAERFLGMELE